MQIPDLEKKLLNLITDLDHFSQDARFSSRLNIFEAVGMKRQEIKHSNFLAFLLTPQESHGLKDGFLKRLIQKAIDNLAIDPPISPLTLALGDFSDALVFREWRNIDVLIKSDANNLIFSIENKIDSTEGDNQLRHYETIVSSEYPTHAKLFGYLTTDRGSASSETWSAISYSDVIDALQEASRRSSNLTAEARMVIDHYVDLIRRNIVPDQELIDQCRKLYMLHKDALDLIIQYGEVNSFASATDTFFKNHPDLKPLAIRSAQAAFLPASLFDLVPPIEGTNWWGQARPLLFWFNLQPDKRFGLVFEVGPLSGEHLNRESLVRKLQEYFNITTKIYPKYTRVYSHYMKLTEDQFSDPEEILTAMESLYKEAADKHLLSIKEIARDFFGK